MVIVVAIPFVTQEMGVFLRDFRCPNMIIVGSDWGK